MRDYYALVVSLQKDDDKSSTSEKCSECFRLLESFAFLMDDHPRICMMVVQLLTFVGAKDDALNIVYQYNIECNTDNLKENEYVDFASNPPWIDYEPIPIGRTLSIPTTKLSIVLNSKNTSCSSTYLRPHRQFKIPYESIQDSIAVVLFRLPHEEFAKGCGIAKFSCKCIVSHIEDIQTVEECVNSFVGESQVVAIWFHSKQDTYRAALKAFRKTHNSAVCIDKGTHVLIYRTNLTWRIRHVKDT